MVLNNSLSIVDVVTKSSDFLKKKGVANYKIDAEWIIAHVLECKRMDLYLRFGEVISPENLNKIRALIVKRGKRVPLQHILENVPFADLNLKCDKRALVPRHETEYFVQLLINKLTKDFKGKIVDLGCGSGAIILALCYHLQKAKGIGYDKSVKALKLANENKIGCNLEDRVKLDTLDWNEEESLSGDIDLIVSNPPYLTEEEWATAEPEVKMHDPYNSLVAKDDGFADIERVTMIATNTLNQGGYLAIEFGLHHLEPIQKIMEKSFDVEILSDQFLVRRFAFAIKK